MSRSTKKTPIHGIAIGVSEKEDKKRLHGIMRTNQREILNEYNKHLRYYELEDIDFDDSSFYTEDEALDVWSMAKDGKRYFNKDSKLMRK